MPFDITNGDGETIQTIYSCTKCIYCSPRKHLSEVNGKNVCTMCESAVEKSRTITQSDGISSLAYRQLLQELEDNVSGVGNGTINNIDEHFNNGDEFIDAVERAYNNRDFSELSCISGIGESKARAIALAVAEQRGWEGGSAESEFTFSC